MTAITDLRPRRLMLTVDELEVLRRSVGVSLPSDFSPLDAGHPAEAAMAQLVADLTDRGLLHAGDDGEPRAHTSLAADLAVISTPEIAVSTRAQTADVSVVAFHAVAGVLGAGLVAIGRNAVELSMFPAIGLGAELARVVPPMPGDGGGETLDLPFEAALHALSAQSHAGAEQSMRRVAAAGGLDRDDLFRLMELDSRFVGSLRALVIRPGIDMVGVVVWVAADRRWHAIEATVDSSSVRRLIVRPVEPRDLGAAVAPLVAAVLA